MTDELEHAPQTREKPAWPFWTTLILILVFVAYPLSTGPADAGFRASERRGWNLQFLKPAARCFYFPIIFAADHSPACKRALESYLVWWTT